CRQARAVLQEIDWPCELATNFSETNLGCGIRMHTAITWAFSLFEEVIILEDDCIPNASFFRFCEELLEVYRHDERVMHISGNNFVGVEARTPYSYYFSKFTHGSGWASWRRAWRHFDWSMSRWPELKLAGVLDAMCTDSYEVRYWSGIFDRLSTGAPDVWDYQWNLACWSQSGLAILPAVNLVLNDGWGPDATHTKSPMAWPGTTELGEILHPPFVFRNVAADATQFNRYFGGDEMRKLDSPRARIRRRLGPVLAPLRLVKRVLKRTFAR
ncbi:MAG: glycosyltransferase family 2 protein, partial [Acidobacteriota bacterium]